MIPEFFRRRQLKNAFAQYVTPELAEQLSGGPRPSQSAECTIREIEFAFVCAEAPDAKTYSQRAEVISATASKHYGVVCAVLPVIVVGFGIVNPAQVGSREQFLRELRESLPGIASAIHGRVTASVGSHGGTARFDFGFWWPQIGTAIGQLISLAPGEFQEFPAGK